MFTLLFSCGLFIRPLFHSTTAAVLLGTLIPAVLTPMMRYSISQRCG
jgi:hypothetical protein